MSKELAKKESDALAEWNSMQRRNSNKTNFIKLVNTPLGENGKENPEYGKIFATHYTPEGEEIREELPKDAEFFLVKTRVQIRCADYDDSIGKPRYWCREVNEFDPISVMDVDGKEVAFGAYKELKEEYDLKFTNAAYVYYNGNLYRWIIGGAHFQTWFDVKGKIDKGQRPYTFKVSHLTDEKVGSNHFKAIHFELGNPYPVEDAVLIARELDASLASYYEKVAEADKAAKEVPLEVEAPAEENPVDLPF
jgi:hypothetical protein